MGEGGNRTNSSSREGVSRRHGGEVRVLDSVSMGSLDGQKKKVTVEILDGPPGGASLPGGDDNGSPMGGGDDGYRRGSRHEVSGVHFSAEEFLGSVAGSVAGWATGGYNCCVFGIGGGEGQSDTRKRRDGRGDGRSICEEVGNRLWKEIEMKKAALEVGGKVYLSAWEVGTDRSETVRDLVEVVYGHSAAGRPSEKKSSDYKSPHLRSFSAVPLEEPVSLSLPRSLSDLVVACTSRPTRSHLFLRLIYREESSRTVGTAHFVDLVGWDKNSDRRDDERMVQRQNHAISKLLRTVSGGEGGELVTCARETKLTEFLCPLMSGNIRPYFVGHIGNPSAAADGGGFGSGDWWERSCGILRIVEMGGRVNCGCVRGWVGEEDWGRMRLRTGRTSDKGGGARTSASASARTSGGEQRRGGLGESEKEGGYDLVRTVSKISKDLQDPKIGDEDGFSGGNVSDDSLNESFVDSFKKRQQTEQQQSSQSQLHSQKRPQHLPPQQKQQSQAEFSKRHTTPLSTVAFDSPSSPSPHLDHPEFIRRRSYALTGGESSTTPTKKVAKRPTQGKSFSFFNKKKSPGGQSKVVESEGGTEIFKGALFKGYLYKKGTLRHNWKKRYFVLFPGGKLSYYASATSTSVKGVIDLRGGRIESVKNDRHKDKFAFDLYLEVGGKGVRHLYAEEEIDRVQWILMLEGGCAMGGGEEGYEDMFVVDEDDDDYDSNGESDVLSDKSNKNDAGTLKLPPPPPNAPSLADAVGTTSEKTLEELAASDYSDDDDNHDNNDDDDSDPGRKVAEPQSQVPAATRSQTTLAARSSKSNTRAAKLEMTSASYPSLKTPASEIPPALLSQNYDTLLSLLSAERTMRRKMDTKIGNLETTLLETSAGYEAELASLTLRCKELERVSKRLGDEGAYKEAFEQFEGEIRRLGREGEELRKRNIQLEMQVFEIEEGGERGGIRGGGESTADENRPPMKFSSGGTFSGGGASSLHKQMTRRVRILEKENSTLRSELQSLRKSSRFLAISKAQTDKGHMRMNEMNEAVRKYRMASSSALDRSQKLEYELLRAGEEAARWRQKELLSSNRADKLEIEVRGLKASLEKLKRQVGNNNLVQKFLDKHGPKVTKKPKAAAAGAVGIHDAVLALTVGVNEAKNPRLMELMETLAKRIEEEVNLGRGREKELMLGMMELLDDNYVNDDDFGKDMGRGISDMLLD